MLSLVMTGSSDFFFFLEMVSFSFSKINQIYLLFLSMTNTAVGRGMGRNLG